MMEAWTATYDDAEERLLDIALAATPEQRLAWLEEEQRFAQECGVELREPMERSGGLGD